MAAIQDSVTVTRKKNLCEQMWPNGGLPQQLSVSLSNNVPCTPLQLINISWNQDQSFSRSREKSLFHKTAKDFAITTLKNLQRNE